MLLKNFKTHNFYFQNGKLFFNSLVRKFVRCDYNVKNEMDLKNFLFFKSH